MNSRTYQNILHGVGAMSSVLMIYGAVIIGGGNFFGVLIMIAGAGFQRISSEVEFRKMSKLIEEHHENRNHRNELFR